jgi:hypothetical protein
MYKLMTGMFSGIVLSQAVLAAPPAVYRDGALHIYGAAMISEEGSTYYSYARLESDEAGNFRIVEALPAELADVETVEVVVTEAEVEAVVQGTKSACVEILEPAVSYQEGVFTAALPVSEPESDVCIEIAEEYVYEFPLDVSELESGVYTLIVNGVEAQFTL